MHSCLHSRKMRDTKDLFHITVKSWKWKVDIFKLRIFYAELSVVWTIKGSGGFLCFEILWMLFWKLHFILLQFTGPSTRITGWISITEDVRLSYLTVPSISKLHETANNLTDTSGVLHTYFHV